MTLLILAIVIGLVAWALRLMERAITNQEFSLMLAGFLVASSAAAMMAVYFLMGNYLLFMHQAASYAANYSNAAESPYSDYATTLSLDNGQSLPEWLVIPERVNEG
jgi:Ca2+/Na+ antiporter